MHESNHTTDERRSWETPRLESLGIAQTQSGMGNGVEAVQPNKKPPVS